MYRRAFQPDVQHLSGHRHAYAERRLDHDRDASNSSHVNVAIARKPAPLGMTAPRARSALVAQHVVPQPTNSVQSSSQHDYPLDGRLVSGRQLSGLSMAAIVKDLGQTVKDLTQRNKFLEDALKAANAEIAEKVSLARDLASAKSNVQNLELENDAANGQLARLRKQLKTLQSARTNAKCSRAPASDNLKEPLRDLEKCNTESMTNESNSDGSACHVFSSQQSLMSVSPSQTIPLPSLSASCGTAHDAEDMVLALQERNRLLERDIALLTSSTRVSFHCHECPHHSDHLSSLRVSDLDRCLREAIESSIPSEHLERDLAYNTNNFSNTAPIDRAPRCHHVCSCMAQSQQSCMQPQSGCSNSASYDFDQGKTSLREDANISEHLSRFVEDEAVGVQIMNRIALRGLSDTSSTSSEFSEPNDPDFRSCKTTDNVALELELREERALRLQKETRVAQLMRILDDRTAAEQQRASSASRAREAIEARLASVERALQAERAGREAAEREAASILSRVAKAQQSTSSGSSPTLGSTLFHSMATHRRRRRGMGFFTWANSDNKSQADDASSTSSLISGSLLSTR